MPPIGRVSPTLILRSGVAAGLALVLTGCAAPHSSREHVVLTAPADVTALKLQNSVGDITIRSDVNAAEVRAEVVKIGKGSKPENADAALGEIEVFLEPLPGEPGTLLARAEHPGSKPDRKYEVEWQLVAPPELALDIANDVGAVRISGFYAGVAIRTGAGEIDARDIAGGLTAHSDVGEIRAEASGRIDLHAGVGDLTLRVLPGDEADVVAGAKVGKVDVEIPSQRRGRLRADADVGSVSIRLDSITLHDTRQRVQHFDADLDGASQPLTALSTEVGDLIVRSYAAPTQGEPIP